MLLVHQKAPLTNKTLYKGSSLVISTSLDVIIISTLLDSAAAKYPSLSMGIVSGSTSYYR